MDCAEEAAGSLLLGLPEGRQAVVVQAGVVAHSGAQVRRVEAMGEWREVTGQGQTHLPRHRIPAAVGTVERGVGGVWLVARVTLDPDAAVVRHQVAGGEESPAQHEVGVR